MRLKNSRNGPSIPLAKASRKVNSILALDGLAKAILFQKRRKSPIINCASYQSGRRSQKSSKWLSERTRGDNENGEQFKARRHANLVYACN
jgi:hypothetical protein